MTKKITSDRGSAAPTPTPRALKPRRDPATSPADQPENVDVPGSDEALESPESPKSLESRRSLESPKSAGSEHGDASDPSDDAPPLATGKPIPIPVIPVEASLTTRIGIIVGATCAGLAAIAVGITLLSSRSSTELVSELLPSEADTPEALALADEATAGAVTTTTQQPRTQNQQSQVTTPATTTTTIETAEDRARVDAFRLAANGTMNNLAGIENHTIRELGEGMCSIASGVTSADGFSVMAELIWVGMEQDTRATYFNDSSNFVASSRAALPIYCPRLAGSLFPEQADQ